MKDIDIFIEEEKRLQEVEQILNSKINNASSNFNKEANTIIGYTEGLRGTQFIRQAKMSFYATELDELKRMIGSPYFGRFDFNNEKGQVELIYVGKKTIMDNTGEILITDWRTPICSLYYDYGIGKASYTSHGKVINGEILEKRQIVIKNCKLIDVKRQDIISDDSFLISYLNDNNDSRLKSIVATIQKEQNKIIRGPLRQNNIVQGVAGSGKTTVALHRLSYLLFTEASNINSSEFMILGPNRYFLDYISTMLPDLDIKNITQFTFENLAKEIINYRGKYKNKTNVLKEILDEQISMDAVKVKNSIKFIKKLEEFTNEYIMHHLSTSIVYEGVTLCDSKYIKDSLYFDNDKTLGEKVNLFAKKIKKKIQESGVDYSHQYWLLNKEKTLALKKGSEERKIELERQEIICKEFKKGCPKVLEDYFKFLKVKPLDLYKAFINSLAEEYNYIKESTLKNLNNKIISDDDLAAILTINNCLKGISKNKNVSHIILDEAQDISPAQYYILKQMYPIATFDIYGDMNQSIFSYQSFNNWDELNKIIFNCNAIKTDLLKSYRTTKQISDVSNLILDELNVEEANCISREGNAVELNNCEDKDLAIKILDEINNLVQAGNKSIAIVTKDEKEAILLFKRLDKLGLKLNVIDNIDQKYNDGICIIPSYYTKGLEFDSVIISDASELKYSNSELDLKLLYVVITRAMHNLVINNTGQLNKALQSLNKNELNKQKVKTL